MGATNNQSVNEKSNATGTGAGSPDSKSSRTGTGGTTGTGGRTGGTIENGKSDKIVPKLVNVDVPGQEKNDQPKKQGRGRPPGSTTKKTTAKKASAASNKTDSQHIKILLLTVSGIIASRENMQVWALTPQEIDSLADPLASVLDKHNVGEATGEYAEYIALVMALFVVFVPKYLMWKEINKQRKAEQKNGITQPTTQRTSPPPNQERTIASNSEQSRKSVTNDGTTFGSELHAFIPSIM